MLQQNGSSLNVQVELNGEIIGTGTGVAKNRNVELSFLVFGLPTVLKATLSDGEDSMHGTYYMKSTGEQQAIQLVRQPNLNEIEGENSGQDKSLPGCFSPPK